MMARWLGPRISSVLSSYASRPWNDQLVFTVIVSEVQGSNRNLTDPRKTGKCVQNDIKMPKMKKEKEDKNDIGKFK